MGVECLRLLNEIIADFDEVSKVPHKSAVCYIFLADFMSASSARWGIWREPLVLHNVIFKDDIVAVIEGSKNTVQWSRLGKFFKIRNYLQMTFGLL